MRNIKRISLALLLVVAMLIQVIPAFAAVSPIVYEVNDDGSVTSYVYARDLSNGAKLYTAVYNEDGSFDFATASAQADKAGYLKTTVAKEEGQTIKSFIWDKGYTPFSVEGEYPEAIDVNDVTITVNGADLREFLAEDTELAFGESYDIDIYDAGFHSTPVVRASSENPMVEASVAYSDDYTSATVTFMAGDRILSEDAQTVTNNAGKTFVAERYTKAVKEAVTINFTKTFLTDGDLVSGSPAGAIVNANTCNIHYKKDFALADGEAAKKISLAFASIPNQSTVIIIEPKDKSVDKQALVADANGTAVAWTNDTQVVKSFDYNSRTVLEYGKKNQSVIATGGTHTAWACRELLFGDNARQNGSRYLTDRDCSGGGYQIYGIDGARTSDLQGCNYIVFASGDKSNVTTDFYVNEDVTIHVYANAELTISDTDGAWDASCKTTGVLNKRYQNSVDAISIAWLMREGVLKEDEISYQKNQNAWYDTNGDHRRQYGDATTNEGLSTLLGSDRVPEGYITGDCMSAYYVMRYDVIDYLIEKSGNTAGWGFDNSYTKKDIPNSLLPYYYSETYKYQDYLDMWKDWDYTAGLADLVTDFNHVSSVYVEDMVMTKGSETATYTGNISISDGVKFRVTDLFGLTVTPDRPGLEIVDGALKNQNATGALVSYPDGFDLEDATFICFTNGPVNDAGYVYGSAGYVDPPKGSYHDMWISRTKSYPWYSFKVTRDAEVLVFASNNVKFLEEDENYDKAMLDAADYFKVMRNMNGPTYYDMTRVYSANYAAGDTVEMKTPGNGEVLYCVFVKEAKNPAIDTALTSISVDGVAIPDFDPEVKEYSVAITDPSVLTAPVVTAKANSAGAAVEVIPATEFPGTTRIVVSHVNGGTDVYTVNHTYDAALLTNLNLMDGVVPKTMMQWAIDAGKLNYTSENDYTLPAADKARPLYFQNRMVLGTIAFNNRSYPIGVVNDTSIYGKDVVIPSYNWIDSTMNVSEAAFLAAGQANPISVDNWVNFDIARKATVKIFVTNGSTGLQSKLQGQGYQKETSNNPYYFVAHNATGGALRNYNVVYSKTFEAGKVNIPNGYTTADLYTIVIDYADYE